MSWGHALQKGPPDDLRDDLAGGLGWSKADIRGAGDDRLATVATLWIDRGAQLILCANLATFGLPL